MSEYLEKFERFEKKIEELKKLEYCDLYMVTEENLGEVSNEIAMKLINTFGIPDVYDACEKPRASVVFGVTYALRMMLYEEPSVENEVTHRGVHDDGVMVHVYSPRIMVDYKRNKCLLAPFTLRCNAGNFITEGAVHISELFAAFDFPKLRFWGTQHYYMVYGDKDNRYVELDWRVYDEPDYPEFKKIKSTDIIGVSYVDGLWATVLTKGDLDYVEIDFDKVNIWDMYE